MNRMVRTFYRKLLIIVRNYRAVRDVYPANALELGIELLTFSKTLVKIYIILIGFYRLPKKPNFVNILTSLPL